MRLMLNDIPFNKGSLVLEWVDLNQTMAKIRHLFLQKFRPVAFTGSLIHGRIRTTILLIDHFTEHISERKSVSIFRICKPS